MAVAKQIVRSCTIAAATLALGGLLDVVYLVALCPAGRLEQRVERHEAVVVDSGYRFATSGEVIVTCTIPHRFGPIFFHEDFDCYCAPAGVDPGALGAEFGGACTVDKPDPRRTDDSGICRHAHCTDFDEPPEVPQPQSR